MLDIQGKSSPSVPMGAASLPTAAIPSVAESSPSLTVVGAIGLVFVVAAAGGYLSFSLSQTKSVLTTRTREVASMKTALATADQVELAARADRLTAGGSALTRALTTAAPWSALLDELTVRVQSGITVTSLSVDESRHVRLNGTAAAYQDLAKFLAGLEASERLESIELESSTLSETVDGTTVSFSLRATEAIPDRSVVQGATRDAE